MIYLLPLLAPILLLAGAWSAHAAPRGDGRLRHVEWAALGALAVSVLSLVLLLAAGSGTSWLLGLAGVGLSSRLDAVSVTMLILVSFVGWIVLRFATTYSDGEASQGAFLARLSVAVAAVLALVQSGNLVQLVLAWWAIGWVVHRLLLFRPDRPAARRAARKKAVSAIVGGIAVAVAALLLARAYGTTDIAAILSVARLGHAPEAATSAAAILLALAAVLKSAQVPMHSWLTEVMEAPTPVSALLHAGVVSAGGFLLIRFADVMLTNPGVLAALVMIGGFSALFGGIVMLTQPAVKTSLAWSTLAQMGFMILQCGLALFPLALLHIVAHSLYKAHAFLSSGGAIGRVAAIRRPGPVAVPSLAAVGRAFAIALAVYAVLGLAFGFAGKSPQALALGAILVFGVAYLIAQGLADAAPGALTLRTTLAALATTLAYFALQTLSVWLTQGALPPVPVPGPLEWGLIVLAIGSFGLVALAQATFPLWAPHPAAAGLRVHLSNGLYLGALVDRWLGGWRVTNTNKGETRDVS